MDAEFPFPLHGGEDCRNALPYSVSDYLAQVQTRYHPRPYRDTRHVSVDFLPVFPMAAKTVQDCPHDSQHLSLDRLEAFWKKGGEVLPTEQCQYRNIAVGARMLQQGIRFRSTYYI